MTPLARPALRPGFDPSSLPDVAPPVPGARSWHWLVEQSARRKAEEERQSRQPNRGDSAAALRGADDLGEYLDRRVAGFGTTDPTDRDLAVRPLPRDQVIASHLDQEVVFDLPGSPAVRLRLSGAGPDEAASPFPFTGPVAIVGTFPPSVAAPTALGRNLAEELQDHLDGEGIGRRSAIAVDRGRRWQEQVLLVDYADGVEVRWAAQLHLQPFLTVWREHDGASVLEVVDLQHWPEEVVVASGPAVLGRLVHRPCPMIPGAGSADLCRMEGGPWISRSITAAARWEKKRSRMVGALGCDTCGDGAIKIFQGGPGGMRVLAGRRNTRDVALEPAQSRHDELVGVPDRK